MASDVLSRFQASISEEVKPSSWLIRARSRPNILRERNTILISAFQGQSILQGRKADKDIEHSLCLSRKSACVPWNLTQGKAHWRTKEKRLISNHPDISLIKFVLNDIKNHY